MNIRIKHVCFWLLIFSLPSTIHAKEVKVTPLGSHDGEFCKFDRAMIFEDPNGTRILYDAGRTVAGPEDSRLGDIDIILISHLHGDHVGDKHIKQVNQGKCSSPELPVKVTPKLNSTNIAISTGAKIVTGSEMPKFLAQKLKQAGGDPKNSLLVRFGASKTIGGVKITTVPAVHSNGINGAFIDGKLGEMLALSGLTAYAGPPTGYVMTFSNGLVVYLSGDTGVTAEQQTVVGQYYGAKLVVINIGDTFTTGPKEAAYVINELIRPTSVIASHANEAATQNGKIREGSRTDLFIQKSQVPVYIPLSGHTFSFNQRGQCVAGC